MEVPTFPKTPHHGKGSSSSNNGNFMAKSSQKPSILMMHDQQNIIKQEYTPFQKSIKKTSQTQRKALGDISNYDGKLQNLPVASHTKQSQVNFSLQNNPTTAKKTTTTNKRVVWEDEDAIETCNRRDSRSISIYEGKDFEQAIKGIKKN